MAPRGRSARATSRRRSTASAGPRRPGWAAGPRSARGRPGVAASGWACANPPRRCPSPAAPARRARRSRVSRRSARADCRGPPRRRRGRRRCAPRSRRSRPDRNRASGVRSPPPRRTSIPAPRRSPHVSAAGHRGSRDPSLLLFHRTHSAPLCPRCLTGGPPAGLPPGYCSARPNRATNHCRKSGP